MIWSVSTLLRRRGTPTPVWELKASMSDLLGVVISTPLDDRRKVGRRAEGAADGGGGGDRYGHQVGSTALALPALEVAVGRGRAALLGSELVGVHPEAHRAPRTAPLGPGLLEHDVEPFLL